MLLSAKTGARASRRKAERSRQLGLNWGFCSPPRPPHAEAAHTHRRGNQLLVVLGRLDDQRAARRGGGAHAGLEGRLARESHGCLSCVVLCSVYATLGGCVAYTEKVGSQIGARGRDIAARVGLLRSEKKPECARRALPQFLALPGGAKARRTAQRVASACNRNLQLRFESGAKAVACLCSLHHG